MRIVAVGEYAIDRYPSLGAEHAGALPVIIGTGLTPENAAQLMPHADGAFVGTSLRGDRMASDRMASDRVVRAQVTRLVSAVSALIVGNMLGSGVFFTPGDLAAVTQHPWQVHFIWAPR